MKNIKIYRSNRKTISLQIKSDLTLILRIPNETTPEEIDNILKKHNDWIERKIKAFKTSNKKIELYEIGGKALFFGNLYPIELNKLQTQPLIFSDDIFYLSKKVTDIELEFKKFYKINLKNYAENRVNYFANLLNLQYNKLTITSAKTRWGSCSSKKNISFSYRLCKVSEELIDYVVAHEVCHLKELNHSKKFYDLLNSVVPDWEEKRKKLNLNSLIGE